MKQSAENKTNKTLKSEKNKLNSIDYSKGIFAHYHNKLRNEIEFSEADFYEDNIYDEPEYWGSPDYFETSLNRHEARP